MITLEDLTELIKTRRSIRKFQDKPDKNNWSHVLDAAQYGVLFLNGKDYSLEDYIRINYNRFTNKTTYKPADSRVGY